MAYFYITCSAACSVLIAHLLKVTENKSLRTLPTLTINYLFAGAFALGFGLYQSTAWAAISVTSFLVFALLAGGLFIGNFLLYSKSVDVNGVGVTIAAMRISLLIPVLISWLLYHEILNWSVLTGIILVLAALLLLIPKKNNLRVGRMHAGWLLLFIFVIAGLADASLKIYQEQFSSQFNELLFMGAVFGAAFLIGSSTMLIRRRSFFTKKEIGMGCLIGIPNLYSSIFLIYALALIDGTVAYSLVNVLNVAAGTALGLLWWHDIITKWQWIGLGLALLAIILLV